MTAWTCRVSAYGVPSCGTAMPTRQRSRRRIGGARLHRAVDSRRRRSCTRFGRPPAGVDQPDGHRHRHPQPLDARAIRRRRLIRVLDQRRTATRFLLGIGCSHAPLIDSKEPGRYRKPLAATRAFLDALDATEQPVPVENRVLAALGPKMLELSATRARGAHPYLVTPDHTRQAREVLGDGPVVASRADRAPHRRPRRGARHRNRLAACLSGAAELRQQSAALRLHRRRPGLGQRPAVRRDHRVGRRGRHRAAGQRAHTAGADHVCVQVLTADPREFPREQWRRLAAALA